MAYVEITLIHQGFQYTVEVNSSSKPNELTQRLVNELKLKGDYGLIPKDSFCLTDNSAWELVKITPEDILRGGVRPKSESS